jgi:hypothetical protein
VARLTGVYGQPLAARIFNHLLVDSGHAGLENFTNKICSPGCRSRQERGWTIAAKEGWDWLKKADRDFGFFGMESKTAFAESKILSEVRKKIRLGKWIGFAYPFLGGKIRVQGAETS